jgi:hypothetical protein
LPQLLRSPLDDFNVYSTAAVPSLIAPTVYDLANSISDLANFVSDLTDFVSDHLIAMSYPLATSSPDRSPATLSERVQKPATVESKD